MPSLLHDIPAWVRLAGAQQIVLRQAVHCVLEAIARTPRLRVLLCMKGGILMALHYQSPRFTTDIDFSTPDAFTEAAEKETVALMSAVLPGVGELLGYDVECRFQGHRVRPSREGTRVNLTMSIGYALKGTPAHRRLTTGQSPFSLSIDFSFRERIPASEEVEMSDGGHLCVYGLTTLVAEKMRALLQQPLRNRYRRQDVFDLHYLLEQRPELSLPQWQSEVLGDLRIKCEDRAVPLSAEAIDDPVVADRAKRDYETLLTEVDGEVPAFDIAFERIRAYYHALPW
ncbi:nucleotidyl transferase AbiEii/AbiGii toxin family protein [Stenotrophomonas rhizophila]